MKVLIGSGGTGGHIYPALALARHILAKNGSSQVMFVGTKRGLESRIIPLSGFNLLTINSMGFDRRVRNIFPVIRELLKGIRQSSAIINNFKPDIVVGTGGYVAAPLVMASVFKGIPVVIHEQNAMPGLANRLLAPFASIVCISFPETKQYFKSKRKIRLTGNPRASEVYKLGLKGKNSSKKSNDNQLIVVYGGSHGSLKINHVVSEYIARKMLPAKTDVVFVTGERYYQDVLKRVKSLPEEVRLFPYLDLMPEILSEADLVITRSGATTIAEISALGIPAILIPSPNVANNEQYHNARILSDSGAAVMIEEELFNEIELEKAISGLLKDPALLREMSQNSKSRGMPKASENLYKCLQEVAS